MEEYRFVINELCFEDIAGADVESQINILGINKGARHKKVEIEFVKTPKMLHRFKGKMRNGNENIVIGYASVAGIKFFNNGNWNDEKGAIHLFVPWSNIVSIYMEENAK